MAGAELAGNNPYLQGKPCPKCAYVRTATDTNPVWQCPKCHIAYGKHRPAASKLTTRLAAEGRLLATEGAADRSMYALIAANAFAAAVAIAFRMDLRDMLLVYWVQSVVIGLSFIIRMLSVKRYAMLGGSQHTVEYVVAAEGAHSGKITAAVLFLLVFGPLHILYLGFLTGFGTGAYAHVGTGLLLCALGFACNHAYSLVRSIRLDRGGIANLSLMMYLPYLRVVPMQAVILLGLQVGGGTGVMLLFMALKTAVDALTHVMEHHEWRREGPPIVPAALRHREPPPQW